MGLWVNCLYCCPLSAIHPQHVSPFIFPVLLCSLDLQRDPEKDTSATVQANYIYNIAKLVEWKRLDSAPLGSSGVQLKLKFVELLAGYTPGACVRVKAERWKFVSMPPEERLTSLEDQQRAARMVLPW